MVIKRFLNLNYVKYYIVYITCPWYFAISLLYSTRMYTVYTTNNYKTSGCQSNSHQWVGKCYNTLSTTSNTTAPQKTWWFITYYTVKPCQVCTQPGHYMAWVIDLCVILSRILAVISHHFGVNLKFIILNNKSIPKMFFNLRSIWCKIYMKLIKVCYL